MSGELPVWRPFALLAFGATLVVATPVGVRLLAWLHLGAPALHPEWVFLHAGLQVFGFFGTLIVGVAPHLFARFTGRPLVRPASAPVLAALLGLASAARVGGTVALAAPVLLAAALVQALAFIVFAGWVWRALDPPPLAGLRRHLTASAGWLALGALGEAALRVRGLLDGAPAPEPSAMRAVYAVAILGGALGWVLGVLLRAGPMFVPLWRVPPALAQALPWGLGGGAALAAADAVTGGGALAAVGRALALLTGVVVVVGSGAFRRAPSVLPMLARSPDEARIFRLALGALGLAAAGAVMTVAPGLPAGLARVLDDAVRHLVGVGFVGAVVVAMAFRLVPVLEGVPLPWPRLRAVALWALAAGVALRTLEVGVGLGPRPVSAAVLASGVLVWVAFACVAANLVGALTAGGRSAPAGLP